MEIKEVPPAVRPAVGERHRADIGGGGLLLADQPLEAAPAVDLQDAAVAGEHLRGPGVDAVLGVDVGDRRWPLALPGRVVAGQAPQVSRPGRLPALAEAAR